MNGALDLSAVGGISVSAFQIGCTVNDLYAAVLIVLHFVASDDIGAHQPHLSLGFHAEEFGRRNL